jgi:DNA (cytosine-5)-methyltransferase 1
MNELALFAGAGGGILGGHLLGWRTVCAVEWEPYPASVLLARQNDGLLPPFPVWDDVRTFDGRPWRGIVDVISGGFPCQDISAAGKGAGIDGERSGLWREMARIVGEVRPQYVFVENSPLLVGRGAAVVIGDLASLGYDAHWCCLSASDVGAPHQRDRFWLVGHSVSNGRTAWQDDNAEHDRNQFNANGEHASQMANGVGEQPQWSGTWAEQNWRVKFADDGGAMADANDSRQRAGSWYREIQGEFQAGHYAGRCSEDVANANRAQCQRGRFPVGIHPQHPDAFGPSWWATEPDVGRVAHGVAARVDRLKAIGNGQVPLVAETAFRILKP